MRGIAGLVLASAVVLAGCYGGPGVDHYVGVLDGLAIPADWNLVSTQRRGPGEAFSCEPLITSSCPGADRWYALSGDVAAALAEARVMVEAAGFSVDRVLSPDCDGAPSGFACALLTTRDADGLAVGIFPPGRSTGLASSPEADVIIKVTAQR